MPVCHCLAHCSTSPQYTFMAGVHGRHEGVSGVVLCPSLVLCSSLFLAITQARGCILMALPTGPFARHMATHWHLGCDGTVPPALGRQALLCNVQDNFQRRGLGDRIVVATYRV